MKLFHLALALIDITALVTAFSPHWKSTRPRTATRDIHEWRDIDFGFPGTSESRRLGSELGPPPKPICILPFPFTDILLQGETKQLRLYEDRFIKLFDCCMKEHGGVVGMGLMADSGIIQVIPLCEIEAYNRMDGFGIFVTIRVVGRAKLLEITQQEPYIQAVCTEMNDKLPPNLELPNLLASNVENFMLLLSSMEHRLEKVDDDSDGDDPKMRRRIDAARLDDRYYNDFDEDDDEEDEDADSVPDRRERFRRAYQVALETDTQGYCFTDSTGDRTPQELTAISWAAFSTDVDVDIQDMTYRIQALDCDNLFDRLKLAVGVMKAKKAALQEEMQKAGLSLREDDEDEK